MVILPLPPGCQDCRHVPPRLAKTMFLKTKEKMNLSSCYFLGTKHIEKNKTVDTLVELVVYFHLSDTYFRICLNKQASALAISSKGIVQRAVGQSHNLFKKKVQMGLRNQQSQPFFHHSPSTQLWLVRTGKCFHGLWGVSWMENNRHIVYISNTVNRYLGGPSKLNWYVKLMIPLPAPFFFQQKMQIYTCTYVEGCLKKQDFCCKFLF